MSEKTYKIPKNRKVVKTININNGVLTAEVDKDDNLYWFRNGKYITPAQQKQYKYYDPSIGGYRTLGEQEYEDTVGQINVVGAQTPVYTPTLDYLRTTGTQKTAEAERKDEEQLVPFNNNDIITLKTKGATNLTDVPRNLLDSIAVNAGRSNTDFWTDAALVAKETTFGRCSFALGIPIPDNHEITPRHFTNNHRYFVSPEEEYLISSYNKFDHDDDKELVKAEKDAKYAVEHGIVEKYASPHYSDWVFADAFKRYAVSPHLYNHGQKNYIPMVNRLRQELSREKQLQEYWNTRGKQYYAKGQREGMFAKGGHIYDGDTEGTQQTNKKFNKYYMSKKYQIGGIIEGLKSFDKVKRALDTEKIIGVMKKFSPKFKTFYESNPKKARELITPYMEEGAFDSSLLTKIAAIENQIADLEGVKSYSLTGPDFNWVDYMERNNPAKLMSDRLWGVVREDGYRITPPFEPTPANYVLNQPELQAYEDYLAERKASGETGPLPVKTLIPTLGTKGARLPYGTTLTGEPARYDGKVDMVRRVNPSNKITVGQPKVKNLGLGKSKQLTTKKLDYKAGVTSKTRNQTNYARGFENNDARAVNAGRNKAEENGIRTLEMHLNDEKLKHNYPRHYVAQFEKLNNRMKLKQVQGKDITKERNEIRLLLKTIRNTYGVL